MRSGRGQELILGNMPGQAWLGPTLEPQIGSKVGVCVIWSGLLFKSVVTRKECARYIWDLGHPRSLVPSGF